MCPMGSVRRVRLQRRPFDDGYRLSRRRSTVTQPSRIFANLQTSVRREHDEVDRVSREITLNRRDDVVARRCDLVDFDRQGVVDGFAFAPRPKQTPAFQR